LPKAIDRTGNSATSQRINDDEIICVSDVAKKAHPGDSATDDADIFRKLIAVGERLDRVDADAIVTHESVANAEDQDARSCHQALRGFTL
jgi:hypothetical protein